MTLLYKSKYHLVLLFFLFGVFGCENKVKTVDFLVDGDKLSEAKDKPDISQMKAIFSGDSVIITDNSNPAKSITSRFWDLNGDGTWEEVHKNKDHFKYVFEEEGIYKMKLCVNSKDNCTHRWINVKPGEITLDFSPTIHFVNPNTRIYTTDEKYLEFEANLENVFDKSTLKLLLNEKEKSYDYDDQSGLLSKKLKLEKGENTISIQINSEDGLIQEDILVDYDKANTKTIAKVESKPTSNSGKQSIRKNEFTEKKPAVIREPILTPRQDPEPAIVAAITTPKPKTSTAAATVDIRKPSSDQKTNNSTAEIEIKTNNLDGPKGLSVLLNGTPVSGAKYSPQKQAWTITVNLKPGKNIVEAKAKNGLGTSTDKISIEYEAPAGELSALGTAGLDITQHKSGCGSAKESNYSFSITPKQDIELLSMTLISNLCGGLELEISSSKGTENTTVALIQGKNQISLIDLNARLTSGTKYKVSCHAISGYGNCQSTNQPKFEDASACNLNPISKSEFNMDDHGKSIIYDLKYLY